MASFASATDTSWFSEKPEDQMTHDETTVHTAIMNELEKVKELEDYSTIKERPVVITGSARDKFLDGSPENVKVGPVIYLSQQKEGELERKSLATYVATIGNYALAASVGGSSTQAFPIVDGLVGEPMLYSFGAIKQNESEIVRFVANIKANPANVLLYNAIGNAVGRTDQDVATVFENGEANEFLIDAGEPTDNLMTPYAYKTGLYKGILPTKLTDDYIAKGQHTNIKAVELAEKLTTMLNRTIGMKIDIVNRIKDEEWGGSWLQELGVDNYNELSSQQFVYYKNGVKNKKGKISSTNAMNPMKGGNRKSKRRRNRKTQRRRRKSNRKKNRR